MTAIDLAAGTRQSRWRVTGGSLPVCAAIMVLAAVTALGIGAVPIDPVRVVTHLATWIAGATPDAADRQDYAVVTMIRGPRVALGLVVGAALGASGAAMQALFRNPLADPGLVGVSAGSAVGAVAAILFAMPLAAAGISGPLVLPVAAFAGGLLTTMAVWRLGRLAGSGITGLLLVGIAINAIAVALVGLMVSWADDRQIRDITFWTLGSVAGARWPVVLVSVPLIAAALLALLANARQLNALLLGEREAAQLGIDVGRLIAVSAVAVAVAVGASVAATGVIGFVGILVPHLARLMVGGDQRRMLPASAFLGAALVVSADAVARTIVAPAELPIGVLCSLVGAACFLWVMTRRARALAAQ